MIRIRALFASDRAAQVDLGLEKSLWSRTPAGIHYEVAGHVVSYLLVRWMIVEAAVKQGLDPLQLSFTHALRELHLMRDTLVISPHDWARTLLECLLDHIARHQVPFRPGRHDVRQKKSSNHKRKSNAAKANGTP
jgi:hypothetical protein